MVSSGQVTSDASTANSILNTYESLVGGIGSSWQGPSSDNFKSQSESFVSSCNGAIDGAMSAFATAVSLYEKYKQTKQSLETAKSNYQKAVNNNDSSAQSTYSNQASTYQTELNSLKEQINSNLQTASSTKLEAEANSVNVGSITGPKGDFVNYYQGDYSNYAFGDDSIAGSGCGPTSMAMVLTALTGQEVTPTEAADYVTQHGLYAPGQGTYWSYFEQTAADYGVNCTQTGVSSETLHDTINKQGYVVLSMGPGHFTSGGHYIVVQGITEDGQLQIADPASRDRSSQTWDESLVLSEAKQMWNVTN